MFPEFPIEIPAPYEVGHKAFLGYTNDPLGNSQPTWDAPESVPVYAIEPHEVDEGMGTLVEQEIADLDILMPKIPMSLKDRVCVDGEDYEVVGVDDWTFGHHGWRPGIVVAVKKVS
jgi:hypothetical protein